MSEKTEAPTPRRLAEARKEGQVARSQELNAAAALLISTWLLTGPGGKVLNDLQRLLVISLSALPDPQLSLGWLADRILPDTITLIKDIGVLSIVLLISGVVLTIGQTGLLWAQKRIGFDFKRLNPFNGFKRLFSRYGLIELVKAILKLVVITWVAYGYLDKRITQILGLPFTDFKTALGLWGEIAKTLVLRVGGAYLILAAADYAYQRWQHTRTLKMSKDEVKEEMKSIEGNPAIKNRIKGQQRKMARMRMMANVPKADVIITNPTHLAIAVQYNPDSMAAPKVLAKGAHLVAQRIVKLARENNIPVIQNIPLARAIYRTVEIDEEIPPELYMAMAEVIAYIYRLRGDLPTRATA